MAISGLEMAIHEEQWFILCVGSTNFMNLGPLTLMGLYLNTL